MIKKMFSLDEEKSTANTLAGISLLATLVTLNFYLHVNTFYEYFINIVIALAVGGFVYIVTEYMRKKKDN